MQIILKSKRIQAIIVLAIAALLVMTGTFAWYSFNQRKVNTFNIVTVPNVNLHDDFAGGPEKDVYVENSGQRPALVRVQLTELLNQNGVLLPDGAEDNETATNWHAHTPLEGVCEVCDFAAHEYFKWTMDGHKFYMPAPESAKGLEIDDDTYTEPLCVGDLDAVIDYAALLRNAFADDPTALDYMTEYLGGNASHAAELQAKIKAIDPDVEVLNVKQYDGQTDELTRYLSEVRLTLIPDKIITMQDWINGTTYTDEPYKTGDFWVVDSDGWCYWANALKMGEATGQLLSSVDNIKNTSGELTYRINVVLNATTFGGTELDEFFLQAQSNGGISEDGMLLMLMASGGYVMGGDGELYKNDGGGLYRRVVKNTDSYANYTIGDPIFAGLDGGIGTADDLETGASFSLDGDGKIIDGSDYTAASFTLGANGVVYINVGGGEYLAPADESNNPDASGGKYAPVHSGEDGKPGNDDDALFEARHFYHIGNGVYIEVETKGETEPKSGPVTYYFAGMETIIENQTQNPDHPRYEVNNFKDANVQDKVNAVFPLQLTVGDGFDVILASDGDGGYYIDKIISGGTEYVMQVLGTDGGNLYIPLVDESDPDNPGRISVGVDGVLGGGMGEAGGTSGGVFVLPKPTGKGTQANPFLIRTRADMDWVSAQTIMGNVTAATYYQIADDVTELDMTASDFTPIGNLTVPFIGQFDGNYKTIINLTVNKSAEDYAGLFGFIEESGKVKDLTLESVNITGKQTVGGVAGLCKGQITNVTVVSGSITGTAFVGGIIGSNYQSFTASVANCTNNAAVTGTSTSNNHVGGIAGFINDGEIIDCVNNGTVQNSGVNTGGIVGYTYKGTVRGSSNIGNVSSSSDMVGGIAGRNGETKANSALVTDCTNSGEVTGINQIGGILGNNLGTIIDCANTGEVTSTSVATSGPNNVGGVVGNNNGVVQTSYSTGTIKGVANNVGGVVGNHQTGSVTNCYAWGNISSTNGTAGGVIGSVRVDTTVSYLYHANGVVTGRDFGAGGVVGQNEGTLSNAVALASEVKRSGVGGSFVGFGRVVGRNTGTATTGLYANSSMTITPEGSHVAGTNCTAKPSETWWSGTADFNFVTIWRWDSTNQLPVLVDVTP